MPFEATSHLTERNEQLYRDIIVALSDSNLSWDEQEDILQRYNQDHWETQTESSNLRWILSEEILQQKIEIYRELRALNRTQDLRNIQTLAGVWVDGVLWPRTFWGFFLIWHRHPSLRGKSPKEIWELYSSIHNELRQEFNNRPLQVRRDIQRSAWAWVDGIFWPNTLQAILRNWNQVSEYFPKGVLWDISQWVIESDWVSWDQVFQPETDSFWESQSEAPQDEQDSIESDMRYVNNWYDAVSDDWESTSGEDIEERIDQEIQAIRSNPSSEYREARNVARRFSRNQIRDFQITIWAWVDGAFWPESFIRFQHSELAELWFSLEEALWLQRIITQDDIDNLAREISRVYGLWNQELIVELLSEIWVWDYISYNPYRWEITHIQDSERQEIIKVKEWFFDTFVNAIHEEDRDKIINTLNSIPGRWNDWLRWHYIDLLQAYIRDNAENDIYAKVRSIFCEDMWDDIYRIDFWNNADLIQKMTASDLFNDQEFLRSWNDIYRRVWDNYLTIQWWRRLAIFQWTQVQFLSQDEKDLLYQQFEEDIRREELRQRITSHLWEFLQSSDLKEDIVDYFWFASQREKIQFVTNIREYAFENRDFATLRNIFASQESDSFTIDFLTDREGVWDIFERTLTAFDLFWDYKGLSKNGVNFESSRFRNYLNRNNARLWIISWDIIQTLAWTERSVEEFSEILEYTPLAAELWRYIRTNYVRAPRQASWVTSCWAAVWAALNNFWIRELPQSRRDGYRWQWFLDARPNQFIKVTISHPDEALPWWILVYDRWAQGIPGRTVNAWRRGFWHVEIKCDENQYCDFARRSNPWGSINSRARWERYKRETGFIWYVYYPTQRQA